MPNRGRRSFPIGWTVGVGQRLKFLDGLHSERCAQTAGAGSVVPEVVHILVIQQVRLT
jgi:hypothetical protein